MTTNTTTPPAQQNERTEETKPIQQEAKATDTQIQVGILGAGMKSFLTELLQDIGQKTKMIWKVLIQCLGK